MTIQKRLGAAVLVSLFLLPVVRMAEARPLPTDSRIKVGKLKNGVTWMYRKHDNPPGKMALMLHVDTGSLNETDAQRGLAHFIEHMCFNGSEHFPPGQLIPYFESIGMEFGADLNAFTSYDQTVYMLFTPDTKEEQISKAMTVMSDYAFRVSMIEEEINKERGVVLEESRRGKGAMQRIRDKLWPDLFEGSRFAERLPIGKDEILANAQRPEFVDYYRAWYRPERMTLIMVGDSDLEPNLPLIEKWFSEYKPSDAARKPMGAEFKPFSKERAMVVTDPEASFCQVQMMNIRPGRPPTTTAELWRTELVETIGTWIVGRRFEELVQKGSASFRNANANVGNFFQEAILITGSANGEPQDWKKMLTEMVTEVHRAREHGFSQRELDLAKKELLAEAEHAVKTEPTENARSLAFGMVFAVNENEPVMSAQQELDLFKEFLPTIDLPEVNATFKFHFAPGTFAYAVTMVEKDGVQVPKQDDVLAAGKSAWEQKVDPLEDKAAPTDLLAAMPTPGKVGDTTVEKDLEITSAWLSNGVRVHHRYMDYKKDSVFVSIALAGGPLEENADNAGISEVAALAVNEAATNRLTSTNIRDIMTGKNISVGAVPMGDSITIQITGSPEDLEIGLQEVHALLTDGKIEDSAFNNWKLRTLQRIDQMEKMPMFKAFEAVAELLGGGDPRLTPINKGKVEKQSLVSAQKWFDRLRKEAPIEVAIVGDIKLDQAKPLIEKYLASLGERKRAPEHLNKLRKLARSTGPLSKAIAVETVTPQAMAMAGFVGCEGRNFQDTRALELAAHVMTSRLVKRIREELSWVYSIRATSQPSWIYADSGRFVSGAPCDPANVDKVIDEVFKMFEVFASEGMTQEELDNAKKQVANNLDTDMREPSYWWDILQHHDLHGHDLKEEKAEKEAYEKFTREQVQTAFKKYFTPERRFHVTAIPKKTEGGEAAAPKDETKPGKDDSKSASEKPGEKKDKKDGQK